MTKPDIFTACASARGWLRELLAQNPDDPMMMNLAFIHNKLNHAIARRNVAEARAAASDATLHLADFDHDDGAHGVICDLRAALAVNCD